MHFVEIYLNGTDRKRSPVEIDFDKMHGLAPAVIQDEATGELLMVGYMNREALETTVRTRFVTFYSRTRQTLWTKGETSGNRLEVLAAWADCDRDEADRKSTR